MKSIMLGWFLIFGFASSSFGGVTIEIVPENLDVGLNTAFCGVVEIKNDSGNVAEFGCPTTASGTMGFQIMFQGEEQLCIPLEPLRRTNALVVLGPGEKVFVPFLVMVDDECSFIFDQIGEYEVRAFVVDRWGEMGVEIENSEKVLVSVYDWELEDEWAEAAFGCTPLNAFGLGLSLEKLGDFSETAPYSDIFPFILGGGRTVTALWRGDNIFLSEVFQSKEALWKKGSVGLVMWKHFILVDGGYSGSRVFGKGDYILDM